MSDGSTATVIVLQHPCALRSNGVDLNAKLLVAPVTPAALIPVGGWTGSYKKMPLPELDGSGSFTATFTDSDVVLSESLVSGTRIASLSQFGVNILLQRWVHHNSRAIIPSHEYQTVTSAEYEEADLTEDWCEDRARAGVDLPAATKEAHDWFRSDSGSGSGSWQSLLQDPQQRSVVRRAMRTEARMRG
ncbi:MAG: hypothetical protein H7201_12130 [Candidatus Saccharibacteria bacterium]|nr:hypothetical protein [Microbacteriaceae bacterium]